MNTSQTQMSEPRFEIQEDLFSDVVHKATDTFNQTLLYKSDCTVEPTIIQLTTKLETLKGSMQAMARKYGCILPYTEGYAGLAMKKKQHQLKENTTYRTDQYHTILIPIQAFVQAFKDPDIASRLTATAKDLIRTWKALNPDFPSGQRQNNEIHIRLCSYTFKQNGEDHQSRISLTLQLYQFTHGMEATKAANQYVPGFKSIPDLTDVRVSIKVQSTVFKPPIDKDKRLEVRPEDRQDNYGYTVNFTHFLGLIKSKEWANIHTAYRNWLNSKADREAHFQFCVQKGITGAKKRGAKKKNPKEPSEAEEKHLKLLKKDLTKPSPQDLGEIKKGVQTPDKVSVHSLSEDDEDENTGEH